MEAMASAKKFQGWLLAYHTNKIDVTSWGSQYLRAIYYVSTTFATVGYGDISGTCRNEYIYTFFLLMSSQLLFSYFSEKLRRILSDTEKAKVSNVKDELLETAKLFLVQVSKVKGARPLKTREIKMMLEYLDAGF